MKRGSGNSNSSRKKKSSIIPTDNNDDFLSPPQSRIIQSSVPIPMSNSIAAALLNSKMVKRRKRSSARRRRNTDLVRKLKYEPCKWLGSIKENFEKINYDELEPGKIYIYKRNHTIVGYWIGRFLGVEHDLSVEEEYLIFDVFWYRLPRDHNETWEKPQFSSLAEGQSIKITRDEEHYFSISKCEFFDIEYNDFDNIFSDNLPTKSPQEICKMMVDQIDQNAYTSINKLPVVDWLYRPPLPPDDKKSEYMTKSGPMYRKTESHFYSLMPPPIPEYSPISRSKKGGRKPRKTRKIKHTKN